MTKLTSDRVAASSRSEPYWPRPPNPTVQIGIVEDVAVGAPHLVEQLIPFGPGSSVSSRGLTCPLWCSCHRSRRSSPCHVDDGEERFAARPAFFSHRRRSQSPSHCRGWSPLRDRRRRSAGPRRRNRNGAYDGRSPCPRRPPGLAEVSGLRRGLSSKPSRSIITGSGFFSLVFLALFARVLRIVGTVDLGIGGGLSPAFSSSLRGARGEATSARREAATSVVALGIDPGGIDVRIDGFEGAVRVVIKVFPVGIEDGPKVAVVARGHLVTLPVDCVVEEIASLPGFEASGEAIHRLSDMS